MIILEGPDLSGKTTLASLISTQFNLPIVHLGAPPKGVRHWDLATQAILENPIHAIYDRLVIGSPIYGPMMGDASPVTEHETAKFISVLHFLKAQVIWCEADDRCLTARYLERGDDYVSLSQILDAAGQYRLARAWWRRNANVRQINYFSDCMTAQSFIEEYSYEIVCASNCPRHLSSVELKISSKYLGA